MLVSARGCLRDFCVCFRVLRLVICLVFCWFVCRLVCALFDFGWFVVFVWFGGLGVWGVFC